MSVLHFVFPSIFKLPQDYIYIIMILNHNKNDEIKGTRTFRVSQL